MGAGHLSAGLYPERPRHIEHAQDLVGTLQSATTQVALNSGNVEPAKYPLLLRIDQPPLPLENLDPQLLDIARIERLYNLRDKQTVYQT